MLYRILADLVVLMHLAFLVFAVLGGVLVFRWKRFAWIHIPAVLWAALIEFADWVCPLTPLENWLLQKGGGGGYQSGFIEHYIVPVVYPTVLTRHEACRSLLRKSRAPRCVGVQAEVLNEPFRRAQRGSSSSRLLSKAICVHLFLARYY